MSESEIAERRISIEDAVDIRRPTEVSLVRLEDGELLAKVVLLRYAGRYGNSSAFAIKNEAGKFVIRNAAQLGLTDDSPYALIA